MKTPIPILLILSLLFISSLSQSPTHYPQNNQIYAPFTDLPIHQKDSSNNQIFIEGSQPNKNEEYVPSQERKQQYEQFNQIFAYGILAGSVILAFTLLKTCTVQGNVRRQHAVRFNYQTHPNEPRVLSSYEIRNQICHHKNEIKRLKKLGKQTEEYERQVQQSRKHQTIKAYQMELQQKIAPHNYNTYQQQQYTHPYGQPYYGKQQVFQRQEFIPIGRPLTKDNDSSFASEYPSV